MIDMGGHKAILGIWLSGNDGASFYASICADLKKRGVSDIFVACHDNLKGIEAINAVLPKTKQQLCIVHQIRNSTAFVSAILRSRDANRTELTMFLNYPSEIRHLIYTTNAVEAYHRIFCERTLKKWSVPTRDWVLAYSHIMIYFADRFAA